MVVAHWAGRGVPSSEACQAGSYHYCFRASHPYFALKSGRGREGPVRWTLDSEKTHGTEAKYIATPYPSSCVWDWGDDFEFPATGDEAGRRRLIHDDASEDSIL
ncbi:hypothetical protein POX_f07723 [Penicillium oxalicum]|nr:hypothetical protein POX_f07723 [Penicillium oxalicum]KAI2787360.1 hypothetical protein POX_f07723 [Penicillium oxalicum]